MCFFRLLTRILALGAQCFIQPMYCLSHFKIISLTFFYKFAITIVMYIFNYIYFDNYFLAISNSCHCNCIFNSFYQWMILIIAGCYFSVLCFYPSANCTDAKPGHHRYLAFAFIWYNHQIRLQQWTILCMFNSSLHKKCINLPS